MEGKSPAQLTVKQRTQVQAPANQPATTPDGQPIQYYYVQQPVQLGQPAQPGQPVFVQSHPGQPTYSQQAGQGLDLTIDSNFLKSPLCYIKIAEFIVLLGAWASIVKYSDDLGVPDADEKANFFKGITIFCWVIVILYLIIHIFRVPKMCNYGRESRFTVTSMISYFIMFALLLACTGNLVSRTVDFGKLLEYSRDKYMPFVASLSVALAFGFLSCIAFVVDMVLQYKLFQTQRAQDTPTEQEPPQRRVWDINTEYLQSPLFYVKLAEIVLLLAAWVCVIVYYDMDIFKSTTPLEDSKADFFRGITIFSWVMVILLTLTFVLGFDKLCAHSSRWTLTALITSFTLFALLISCCGNLTPQVVDYAKMYKAVNKDYKSNILALIIGLAFGFLSCIAFVVDIVLYYKFFQTQRAQETPTEQGPPQRRAWDINTDFLNSSVFKVKLAETFVLFAAWVCVLMYFDMDVFKTTRPLEDSDADFFRGTTIFSWVMAILLTLTSVLSFDKLCGLSSRWTLTTLFIYFLVAILLIACCGNLTKPVVDWTKVYKTVKKEYKPNILALMIALLLGYISWIIVIVDIILLFKLYRQQRAKELGTQQHAGQPGVVQHPAVVIVPQGAQQPAFQPVAYPGQQPVHPGQQPVMIAVPPPAYSQQARQWENQK